MHKIATLALLAGTFAGAVSAQEGNVPTGIPHLDHVFVIMMENHGYGQIVGNPNTPFINQYAKRANVATNYYAIAHPSLTNYLEVVGASNFGIHDDNYPDWHNSACTTNLASATVATDNPHSPNICPIWGTGTDAATPAIDITNETQGLPGEVNIDGTQAIAENPHTVGKTLADQVVASGLSWKTYQESIPEAGIDQVNYSDGVYSNLTDFTKILPAQTPALTSAGIVALYAAKHNPFVYFRSVQEGTDSRLGLKNTADFEGAHGLFADLASGNVPTFAFVAPNQCNDQHGRGNAGPFCNYDPKDDGTQAGLNPALMYRGDVAVQNLVGAIHKSPVWKEGRSAIVIIWDEDDYSIAPTTNHVLTIVDTNYGVSAVQSGQRYTHFSVTKSIEAGLGLPCLNHACDSSTRVMADLFKQSSGDHDRDGDDN